jgi:hypothetical protein
MRKALVTALAALTILPLGSGPSHAHRRGPARIHYQRAWTHPAKYEVRVEVRWRLLTDRARVAHKRKVSVEWLCPDESYLWTGEVRAWTRTWRDGPWNTKQIRGVKGNVPPNPGACMLTGRAKVTGFHVHATAL